jgi:hypothetical protein
MKKLIILLAIIICNFESNAQFFHSIEFNNGISLSSLTKNPPYSSNETVTSQFEEGLIFIGLASVIKINYFNHKYWNLSSEIGFMELSQKNKDVYYNQYNVEIIQNTNYFINMLHFNTLIEFKYPNWKIVPSLKIGPRLDYTFINLMNNIYDLNKINYGFVIGIGISNQLNNKINIHLDSSANWYKKDVINASEYLRNYPLPLKYPSYTIKKNYAITLGFGYIF